MQGSYTVKMQKTDKHAKAGKQQGKPVRKVKQWERKDKRNPATFH